MQEFMHAQGTAVHIISPPYEKMHLFDGGLREQLYTNYDFDALANRFANAKPKTVYTLTDNFETHYIFFKLPSNSLVIVGPYMTRDYREITPIVSHSMNLPPIQEKELKEYYVGIPKYEINTGTPESKIMLMAKYLYGDDGFTVDSSSTILKHTPSAYEVRLEPERLLSYTLIEERYAIEDAMLNAVERGDIKDALHYRNQLSKYSIEDRNPDNLRNLKTLCITFNTLLRKAAQRGSVHPAYIDSVSMGFARAIEAAVSIPAVTAITADLVQKYCRLVQEHNLKKYSPSIQKALNYIDFHYSDTITLPQLADIARTNANYLSTQFKKEVGLSITDHINHLRVRRSLQLLATTDAPISVVSEKVGFMDFNYYTRVFKKVMEKSPSEYRKSLRGA